MDDWNKLYLIASNRIQSMVKRGKGQIIIFSILSHSKWPFICLSAWHRLACVEISIWIFNRHLVFFFSICSSRQFSRVENINIKITLKSNDLKSIPNGLKIYIKTISIPFQIDYILDQKLINLKHFKFNVIACS